MLNHIKKSQQMADIKILVAGSLNTDIVASDVHCLLGSGELTRSGELSIGPGGKSCNIARMMALLLDQGMVAMMGKTSRDCFNLWEMPYKVLQQAGVVTDYITIESYEESGLFPGVALIPVNSKGENQIYCLPGINDTFSPIDIDRAVNVFKTLGKDGLFVLSLEMPLQTAVYAIQKANRYNTPVVLDPGGIESGMNYDELLSQKIYLMKPNEHETKILTGIDVSNRESAREAAKKLLKQGVENIVITHGKKGAYYFSGTTDEHFVIPEFERRSSFDETGCGDQVTAVICSELINGNQLASAVKIAVYAGTMQFHREGIQPLSKNDILAIHRMITNE